MNFSFVPLPSRPGPERSADFRVGTLTLIRFSPTSPTEGGFRALRGANPSKLLRSVHGTLLVRQEPHKCTDCSIPSTKQLLNFGGITFQHFGAP